MNREKMAQFISSLRKEKNLMQQDVAELFNVSPQAVSKWEKGDSIPDIEILEKMSSFYQVSIEEILNGERKEEVDNIVVTNKVNKNENSLNVLNLILGIGLLLFTIILFFLPFLGLSTGSFYVYVSGYNIIFSSNFLFGNFIIFINYFAYIALGVIEIILSFNIEKDNLNKIKYILLNCSSFLTIVCTIVMGMYGTNILIGIILFSILNIVYFILNFTVRKLKNSLKEWDSKLGSKIIYLSIIFVLLLVPSSPLVLTIVSALISIALIALLLLNAFKLMSNLWYYIISLALLILIDGFMILCDQSVSFGIIALVIFAIFVPIHLTLIDVLRKKTK